MSFQGFDHRTVLRWQVWHEIPWQPPVQGAAIWGLIQAVAHVDA